MSIAQQDRHVEALLEHLKGTRSFDFAGYKKASLVRRIQRRMQALDVARQVGDHGQSRWYGA